MSFSIPIILLFLNFFFKKSKNNSNNEPNKALKRDRETQKCCELLNKTNCFTIYCQNKRPKTNKTFESERKMNLRDHHLCYIGLPLPSRR